MTKTASFNPLTAGALPLGQDSDLSLRVRPAQVHDPEFVRAVFTLAAQIRFEYKFDPSEWREVIYFLCRYAENLGINAKALENAANLDTLLPSDEALDTDEQNGIFECSALVDTKLFEDRFRKWSSHTLSRVPTAEHPYVHSKTREWFLTVATVLQAIFPDVVRHKPIWNSPRHRKTWKKVKAAWMDEKDRRERAEARAKSNAAR
ncbi:hypothetical protein OCEANICA350_12804 [Oceanicaulis sp. 350]|nr:hypothetical protein OCEANICA350_12804 [Oceanicaulis sp. 350]